ncbi:MAG: histidine ammonia-lyase [Deltaproteobacteria bacterium]|nr:histidine ammonia-lyase [Deltaproteobacteria bacterium]
MTAITIDGEPISWTTLREPLAAPITITLAPGLHQRLAASRAVVDKYLGGEALVYAINTGFGIFARQRIAPAQVEELQRNLIESHAAGVGDPLSDPVVRLMMLLKLQNLALGYSGVRPTLVETVAAWLSADALPVIPAQGSVGASGDLAPLAHMTRTMMGAGETRYRGTVVGGKALAQQLQLPLLTLGAKEGLAMINGTQAMVAVGAAVVEMAENCLAHATVAGAMTIEGLFGSIVPFDARLHAVRPHPGAIAVAEGMRRMLAKSQIVASHRHCARVQDPYALRCLPSVHGAVLDALQGTRDILLREANSATDNPLIFLEGGAILSGGNFHGAPVALAMDHLAIALATLASISERRIEQLINPKAGELPVLGLTPNPGLHSGFMVAHTTAASLVSECKTLAHPASVDTIPTWGGQEDHVSMGMWAARKALRIVEQVQQVIAIELLAAAQAIDLHPQRLRAGIGVEAAYQALRRNIPAMERDRYLAHDLAAINALVHGRTVRSAVEATIGPIFT